MILYNETVQTGYIIESFLSRTSSLHHHSKIQHQLYKLVPISLITIFPAKSRITITTVIILKINALSILARIIPTIILGFNQLGFNQLNYFSFSETFGFDQVNFRDTFGFDQFNFRETFAFCYKKEHSSIVHIWVELGGHFWE